eukprot:CAMPEP_0177651224 /NCGR_PEP_ID=MMETSP0447-20121125/12415_1 /TAXON_ID=0 /ORGANISM="Stygamoeba regulata, Strain BSH-02190019" /LENGTH=166 /DNA_ID=CAMNT_0019154253 /DNA_START=50 /DNA_END=550 /DNA_ORIENTATION=+
MASIVSSIAHEQKEGAFQKQPTIFVGRKRVLGRKVRGQTRYWKDVGLGFKTPKAAIENDYVDKKCPFTGNVSIRGRILRGTVVSTKMQRTIVVRRDYLHWVPKYNRYEKRHKNISAHISPCFKTKVGDVVTIGQCRPLSKTVRFNVLKVDPQTLEGLQKKKRFRVF